MKHHNAKTAFPINTSDDLLEVLHDAASITSCIGALLQNTADLDAMDTDNMRPVKGLSLLLTMTAETVAGVSDDLEAQRQNRAGHFEHLMSDETKVFASLNMTAYGPMLRAIVRRMSADAKRPESDRLPTDQLLQDITTDMDIDQADRERLLEAMNNHVEDGCHDLSDYLKMANARH